MHFRLPFTPCLSDWLIMAAVGVLAAVSGYALGFSAPHGYVIESSIYLLMGLGVASSVRIQNLFPNVCNYLALLVWIGLQTFTMAHANYVLTAYNLPLMDSQLAWIDGHLLGIDHHALRETVASNAVLSKVLSTAYNMTAMQMYVALAFLLVTRNHDRIADTLSIVFLGALATLIVSALIPVIGPYGYFNWPSKTGYLTDFDLGNYYDTYLSLRSGTMRDFPVADWHGIVTFPSYHTIYTLAALYAVAHIRPLLIVSSVFTAVVIVSTLPVGGHYLIDVFVGLGIFCAIVAYVERRRVTLNAARKLMTNPAGSEPQSGAYPQPAPSFA